MNPAFTETEITRRNIEYLRTTFFDNFPNQPEINTDEVFWIPIQPETSRLNIPIPEPGNILSRVDKIRKTLIHDVLLRGTSLSYSQSAKDKRLISEKAVDEWYEDKTHSVASHLIPTLETHLSNKEFLYWLHTSVLSSILFAQEHTYKEPMDRVEIFKEGINLTLWFYLEKDHRRNTMQRYIPEALSKVNRYPEVDTRNYVDYLCQLPERFEWGGQKLQAFSEHGFTQRALIDKYSPRYIDIPLEEIQKLIERIEIDGADENQMYKIVQTNLESLRTTLDPRVFEKKCKGNAVAYLLSEIATLKVLDILEEMGNDNIQLNPSLFQ